MTFASNPGFLAIAFMEGSAAFILLVLYWLLVPGFPARFFRYWLAGWTIYVGLEGLRIYSLWRGGSDDPRFVPALSLMAAALFLAAVLECRGLGRSLKYLWPLGGIAASAIIALGSVPHMPQLQRNAESLFRVLPLSLGGLALLAIAGAASRRWMEVARRSAPVARPPRIGSVRLVRAFR